MMRYPGGKLRLQKKINKVIELVYPDSKNNWVVGEPFTGGGGSLINMALDFPNWKFRINDLNPEVYTFWKFFALANPKEMADFYKKIEQAKPTLKSYYEMFGDKDATPEEQTKNCESMKPIDRAFRIIFLNKTSFGGYITQALPIGGKKQQSKWHVDEYWNPKNIIKKCQKAKSAIDGKILSVDNLDCSNFVKKYKFDFVYADPPYIVYGKQWYGCDFDMKALTKFREDLSGRWCISMDSIKETKELFKDDRIELVDVKHTAKSLTKGTNKIKSAEELVVFPK